MLMSRFCLNKEGQEFRSLEVRRKLIALKNIAFSYEVDFHCCLFTIFLGHVSLLAANLLVGLLYLFTKGDMGGTFGLALVYCILFTPASFVCWFRPAYKAFR